MKRILANNKNSVGYWDSIYDARYDRDEINDKHKIEDVVNSIKDGASVLDVGCGTGHFLREIKKNRPNCECVGMDYSPSIINRLKQTDPTIKWFTEDIVTMKITRMYDYVLCFETLEHIDNVEIAVKTIGDLTADKAIIAVPYLNRVPSEEHVWEFDGKDLDEMFGKLFKNVWVYPVGSGKAVYEGKKIIQPFGTWDILMVKAEK